MDENTFVEKILKVNGQHRWIYHFTDTRNLPSIRQHGLLSTNERARLGVIPTVIGGNEWSQNADEQSGMDDYVHLCFLDTHPMEYLAKREGRIIESVFLRIRPDALLRPGVLATNDVANQSGVTPMPLGQLLDDIDLKVIYTRTDWTNQDVKKKRKAIRRCEILVPQIIPPEYILNL